MPGTARVAESLKATVRTQNCFLRDILGIGSIAQDSARNPERQRAALLEPLFKLAPEGSRFKIEPRLGLRRAAGPGEFLHLFSPYNCQTPPPGFEFDREPIFMMNAPRVRSCVSGACRSGGRFGGGWEELCFFLPGTNKDYKYSKRNQRQRLSSGLKPTVKPPSA